MGGIDLENIVFLHISAIKRISSREHDLILGQINLKRIWSNESLNFS